MDTTQSPYILQIIETEEENTAESANLTSLCGIAISIFAAFAATFVIIYLISIALRHSKDKSSSK